MAHFPPSRFVAACCLGAALLLSGCCANNVCDCPDELQADAITLRFRTGADTLAGGQGFGKLDLDTVIVQRSPLKSTTPTTTKPEVVVLIRAVAQGGDLVLNNNTPFSQIGTTKLNAYKYVVQYLVQQPRQKPVPATALVIDSVRLRGSFDGTGCCTCYHNTGKTVFLNGVKAEKDLSSDNSIPITR